MFVLIAEVEMFPVMEKMNQPVPHQLSFLRPMSTVRVAAISIAVWINSIAVHGASVTFPEMDEGRKGAGAPSSQLLLLPFTACCAAS